MLHSYSVHASVDLLDYFQKIFNVLLQSMVDSWDLTGNSCEKYTYIYESNRAIIVQCSECGEKMRPIVTNGRVIYEAGIEVD